jgi:hypothetical protein
MSVINIDETQLKVDVILVQSRALNYLSINKHHVSITK